MVALRLSDSFYDKLLLALAQLAPVTFVFLNGWYESLTTWYVPLNGPGGVYSVNALEQKTKEWLKITVNSDQLTYYVFVDSNCPCTKSSLKKFRSAVAESTYPEAKVVIFDISDHAQTSHLISSELLQEIPAVPMIVAAKGTNLIYTGPANSGSFCTTKVDQALPVLAASSAPTEPVHNWIAEGCYCRIQI